jgi:hypothetical protein
MLRADAVPVTVKESTPTMRRTAVGRVVATATVTVLASTVTVPAWPVRVR